MNIKYSHELFYELMQLDSIRLNWPSSCRNYALINVHFAQFGFISGQLIHGPYVSVSNSYKIEEFGGIDFPYLYIGQIEAQSPEGKQIIYLWTIRIFFSKFPIGYVFSSISLITRRIIII